MSLDLRKAQIRPTFLTEEEYKKEKNANPAKCYMKTPDGYLEVDPSTPVRPPNGKGQWQTFAGEPIPPPPGGRI